LTKSGLFGYTLQNEVSDWASRNQVGTRAMGAIEGVVGAAGAVTGSGIMAAGCETGVACVAGFILAATSADYFQAGYRQMVSGSYTPTLGQQVLTDLGLSPTTAAWTDAAMSLGAEVGAAASLAAGAGADSAVAADAANSTQAARLNMQLSAEQAAGVRAPTSIASYSDHAITQIASRDAGIGVSQAAVNDAFANPVGIQYVPSKYGPAFKYIGQNATVVVNPQGRAITAWATSAAGVAK
jgi:hypothetical protein